MPKKFIKKYLPNPETIKKHKSLQFLGDKLHDPNLWHLNRHSVSMAFAVGLFCAWIPTPTQMAIAAVGAVYFRSNLPLSVALVWITNPITMPPLFYFAYIVGLWVLNVPGAAFSLDAVLSGEILLPFLTGCLVLGVTCAIIGQYGILYLWNYYIQRKWAERRVKRAHAASHNPCRSTQDWRV
jgi:hypothetical protein